MKAISKQEYIRRKDKIEEIYNTYTSNTTSKLIAKINKKATKFFIKKINKVDSFKEPRIIDYDFYYDDLYTLSSVYKKENFLITVNKIKELFPYLDVQSELGKGYSICWIRILISLKTDK